MLNKVWHELFEIKQVRFTARMTGFAHEMEVTTADGKTFLHNREDNMRYSSYQNYIYPSLVSAKNQLAYGIEYGFKVRTRVGDEMWVQPIAVQSLTIKAVNITQCFYRYYLWFKPELPSVNKTTKSPVTDKVPTITVTAVYDTHDMEE